MIKSALHIFGLNICMDCSLIPFRFHSLACMALVIISIQQLTGPVGSTLDSRSLWWEISKDVREILGEWNGGGGRACQYMGYELPGKEKKSKGASGSGSKTANKDEHVIFQGVTLGRTTYSRSGIRVRMCGTKFLKYILLSFSGAH